MKSLARIYLKYMSSIIGLIAVFLVVEMLIIYFGAIRAYDTANSGYELDTRTAAEIVTVDSKGQVANGEQIAAVIKDADMAFAMVLSGDGDILWKYRLPENLDHSYSVADVSVFSKWYLDDHPIFTWKTQGDGLLVAGYPENSVWRYNFWEDQEQFQVIMQMFLRSFGALLTLTLLVFIWMGYRSYRKVRVFTRAIADLAAGKEVLLSERGSMGEIAASINQTSERLQRQMKMLRERDEARTQWISGVSHDIRTPLSLVLGYSNLLEEQTLVQPEIRREAALIRQESLRIRDLIEDLNLTSKLEYHMQPLRMELVCPAKILRKVTADMVNSIVMEEKDYPVQVKISREFEELSMEMDEKLMDRALRNLISNAVRHNKEGCSITVEADCGQGRLCMAVTDTGTGIPRSIYTYINEGGKEPKEHVMGLRIVKQIINAHGGIFRVEQEGHRAVIEIPLDSENLPAGKRGGN